MLNVLCLLSLTSRFSAYPAHEPAAGRQAMMNRIYQHHKTKNKRIPTKKDRFFPNYFVVFTINNKKQAGSINLLYSSKNSGC
jgi:hypothetical protein